MLKMDAEIEYYGNYGVLKETIIKEEILKDVMGPSGNLRAPAWRIGAEFIVGFNPELYQEMFG